MIHIHNGDLIASRAKNGGIPGEHIPFRESLATGPATRDVETRTQFLSSGYGENPLRVRNNLLAQQEVIQGAGVAEPAVLWFEHDLFCLANLMAILHDFESAPAAGPRQLEIIWKRDPLSESDLTELYEQRETLDRDLLRTGASAWSAYASDDPRALQPFLQRDDRSFAFLREGLLLHAARFPSRRNGLGVVEERLLRDLLERPAEFGGLFGNFDPTHPRLGLGDTEVLRVLRRMAAMTEPMVTLEPAGDSLPQMRISITGAGELALAGERKKQLLDEIDEWAGGVHLTRDNGWEWDEDARAILPSRSAG